MKKSILLASLCACVLLGCTNKTPRVEETSSSTSEAVEQSTEQSSSTLTQQSTQTSSSKEQLQRATGVVRGSDPLYVQFANSMQQWTESSGIKIYYFSYAQAALLPIAKSEMTPEQIQKTSDGLLEIKHNIEKTYKITDENFTASQLFVFDKNEERLAVETDGKLILDQ